MGDLRGKRSEWTSVREIVLLIALLSGLFASACTMPYKRPCLRPADAVFPGMIDALKDANGNSVPEVSLLVVHGMGTTTYQWIEDGVGGLATALGFHWDGAIIPFIELKNGALLYQLTLQEGSRRLIIHAILWSPVTAKAKKTLCYDVTQATLLCTNPAEFSEDTRALGNALLKNQLMDDRLSDVTFYLGQAGGVIIRESIQDALLRALSTNALSLDEVVGGQTPVPKLTPVFLMSESLGSKIVVESLEALELIPNAKEFTEIERSHIDLLFLLANQIPILGLGQGTGSNGVRSADSSLRKFIRKRSERRHQDGNSETPLHIVAFSDPNDVFSYQLSQAMFPGDSVVISNVVISNDKTYIGVLENPITAHTGYFARGAVVGAIAHGSSELPTPAARISAP